MNLNHILNKTVFKSLQVRIIFVIIVFMLLPVLYFLHYNFSSSEKMLQEKTSNLILDNLQQVGNQIENTCLDIIKLSNVINADNTILSELISSSIENLDRHIHVNRQKNYYELSSQD